MSYVRLVNVTKKFGDVTAVNSLNLEIGKGECFSMLGPSGCGKTTTLRMVAGFEDLSEGEIYVGDRLISSPKRNFYLPPEKRNFGMVFQAFAVWPHLSVYENVAFPLRIRKLPAAEVEKRTQDALRSTNLLKVAEDSPADLSGGGKQRVALARALAINPDVMLLDEPLSSLDPHLREEMRFEIKDLQRKYGFSIIYVTHDQSEAMALSDRILVMRSGVVQQIDTPLNVYNQPANKFVFSFIGLSNFLDIVWEDGRAFVRGEHAALPASLMPPESMRGEDVLSLASRPSEIDFITEGDEQGLRGILSRKAFLGEIIDYQVKIGDQEMRVQKGRRDPGPELGEACNLRLLRPFWYAGE
ncbi:Vitamin B12 import ATP-binding protein BtuD [Sporomusa acidovorans DSM 3132]|uniref:Vitamin B12 import ATP-binding protein BtuD n=2 Tax=Sporomusa TaxID=2375 RepID=A0ABZ3J8Y7_SPOA4|nr:spermidine/putrescine import ATP-binding protein PotA [Sporomusa acidovorans DSM 3132]SDE32862.1 iron(III) transport system ATP-binding protein [Sporomusa acidovorans]